MSKEAMELALEALLAATPVKAKDPQMQAVAIVALQEALEHPVQEPVAWRWSESNGERWFDWTTDWSHHDKAKSMGFPIEYAYTTPPAQPAPVQQESVAWEELTNSQIMASVGRCSAGFSESRPLRQQWDQVCDLIRYVMRERGYTTPPAAQPAPADERKAFENHWYDEYHSGSISAGSDGSYFGRDVQKAWNAWWARANLAVAINAPAPETPFQVGRRLRQEGKGIYDLWGAVRSDADLVEAHRGFDSIAPPAAPAAPVQEPEYVQIRHIDEVGDASPWGQPLDPKERHTKWAKGFEMRLLYTAPPAAQRSWVGLTDEQVTRLCKTGAVYAPDGVVTRTPLQYREELEGVARTAVRKAEAKLKELNA